jgi:hypothetical protein
VAPAEETHLPEIAELTVLNAYLLLFVPEISVMKSDERIRIGASSGKPDSLLGRNHTVVGIPL